MTGEHIRIRGTVQGVGFRPAVARLAFVRGIAGFVRNDADGVLIGLAAAPEECTAFVEALLSSLPPLAKVDGVERTEVELEDNGAFEIIHSEPGAPTTQIPPDAAACAACTAEVFDPMQRRYRYPFGTCTDCGPRYSIAKELPLDRETTTMKSFALCDDCRAEYEDPTNRRYHAQPIACHICGPQAKLVRADGHAFSVERYSMMDQVDAVGSLLQLGEIVAIKGIGGFHLCCDATNEEAVAKLRERKQRYEKPLAMMARDLHVIRRYATVSDAEQRLLESSAAPIVLLDVPATAEPVAPSVAPHQRTLGFMLPYTPLHHLALRRVKKPIVCTSGNVSHEPQCIDDEDAKERLAEIADWFLLHDRPIQHRVDDSVMRVVHEPRVVRRARGLAPSFTPMPRGLSAPRSWAAGGQLKATFTFAEADRIVMSPHLGDLDDLRTLEAYEATRKLMAELFEQEPEVVAVDLHPEYAATQLGRTWAAQTNARLIEVQHHHAHVAAVMAEHGYPADGAPVIGVALDGLGMGPKGALWGGEFMLATYRAFDRVGTFKPVALLGGDVAARQPWRSLYAHLRAEMGWRELEMNFGELPVVRTLMDRPRATLDSLLATKHAPRASSCGRLFDAVAAAIGLCFEAVSYEGQAAMALEALVGSEELARADGEERYPIGIPKLDDGTPYLEPLGMWNAILGDLHCETPPAMIAARFHVALAEAIVRMVQQIATRETLQTVVLAGGCFQNRILLERVGRALREDGLTTLEPVRFPAHDGALSLGQAVVAAAKVRS